MLLLITLLIVFLLICLSGIFQLLQAAWDLREGSNRSLFVRRGIIGFGLIIIAFLVPYVIMFFTSMNYVVPPQPMPGTGSSFTKTVPANSK